MKKIKKEIQPKKMAYTTENISKYENWLKEQKKFNWHIRNYRIIIIIFTIIIIILSIQLYLTDKRYQEQKGIATRRAVIIEQEKETNRTKEQYITKLKGDIEDFRSIIASKDTEIKRLGGVVNEKDKTIAGKDTVIDAKTTQIKTCNTDLNTEKVTSSILANWAARFTVIGAEYNTIFGKYNNYVMKYVYLDDSDVSYLNSLIAQQNATARKATILINEINN